MLKGAAELDVQDFVLVMANDCLNSADQNKYAAGLQLFDDFLAAEGRPRFSELDRTAGERALGDIWARSDPRDEALETVHCFLNTSKWYNTYGGTTPSSAAAMRSGKTPRIFS